MTSQVQIMFSLSLSPSSQHLLMPNPTTYIDISMPAINLVHVTYKHLNCFEHELKQDRLGYMTSDCIA